MGPVRPELRDSCEDKSRIKPVVDIITTESLILAQNERWRRGLGMQVERESFLREVSKVANGRVTRGKPAL